MKRILAAACLVALALLPLKVHAIVLAHDIKIGTSTASCDTSGYISPSTNTYNQGQEVKATFVNEQPVALEIRNFPGGTFTVNGNSSVVRNFTAASTFKFSAYTTDGLCKKAEATYTVTPAPEPEPAAPSTPSSSPTPTPQTPVQAEDREATETEANNEEVTQESVDENGRKGWWLLPLLLLLILLYLFKRRSKRSRR